MKIPYSFIGELVSLVTEHGTVFHGYITSIMGGNVQVKAVTTRERTDIFPESSVEYIIKFR